MRRTIVILMALLVAAPAVAGPETTISGFADAAWTWDNAAQVGTFGVDQVEVDIDHTTGERTSLSADLEWVKDGEGWATQVEQAFMTYNARCGWALSFGKFNAPIGCESLDPVDMYQYSHGLLFTYGTPTNLTGVKVARGLGHGMDLVLHASNGWDRATSDDQVTGGGRLGLVRGGFSGGLSAISGSEIISYAGLGDPLLLSRDVVDIDVTWTRGAWRFCGEANSGTVSQDGAEDAGWGGLMLMAHVDFSPRAGFTVRLDGIDDQDGLLFGLVDGEAQARQSWTFAPTFTLDDGLAAVIELRVDKSDRDAFTDHDGLPTDRNVSVAVEMTGSW